MTFKVSRGPSLVHRWILAALALPFLLGGIGTSLGILDSLDFIPDAMRWQTAGAGGPAETERGSHAKAFSVSATGGAASLSLGASTMRSCCTNVQGSGRTPRDSRQHANAGAGKQEALEQLHAEPTKHLDFFRRFHALCDHLDPKLVAYRYEPLHDGEPHGAETNVSNEAPVELDDVRLKSGQQFKARIGSTEVIDRRGESEALESSEIRGQRGLIGDGFAFSEFEYQAIDGKADPLGRAHGGMKTFRGPRNVVGRNVEAQPGLHAEHRRHFDCLHAACLVEGKPMTRFDSAEHLERAFAVNTAHERLMREYVPLLNVDDRLERDREGRADAVHRNVVDALGSHRAPDSRRGCEERLGASDFGASFIEVSIFHGRVRKL